MSRRTLYTDLFNRADNADLGADWDNGYTGRSNLAISSQNLVSDGADDVETNNATSVPADQWAQITIPTITDLGGDMRFSVLLRASAPPTVTWYEFTAAKNNSYTSRIVYRLNGTNTAEQTENATSLVSGDILRAEAHGTSLSLYRNSDVSPLVTLTDANIASGRPGLQMFIGSGTGTMDDFIAGDFIVDSVTNNPWGVIQQTVRIPNVRVVASGMTPPDFPSP